MLLGRDWFQRYQLSGVDGTSNRWSSSWKQLHLHSHAILHHAVGAEEVQIEKAHFALSDSQVSFDYLNQR